LIAQSGIIVTGAIVRLTGSGLGCPTWPDCAPGSLIPVAGQVEGFHKYIEFGNRTLTFLVLAISIALFVFSLLNEKRNIIIWSFLPLIGTLLQAVLGGITVLTGLHPATVMAHFLLSIVLVGISVKIYDYFNNQKTFKALPKIVDNYVTIVTLVGLAVIILGTITTGSGPHSGDEIAARFDLDIRVIAWLHADSVLLFVGLIVGLLVISRINKESKHIYKITRTLFIICLVQGFIGYVQWFSDLPWILVSFHVIGAVITWIAITNLALYSSNTLLKRLK
jgi:cytochrome c oxidase assembly protein subunit 15